MVNVDGVVYGNSRCDLAGFDVNRQWLRPHTVLHPQVIAIKNLLASKNILLAIDLHGHSKKMASFGYCCSTSYFVNTTYYPYILSKIDDNFKFS